MTLAASRDAETSSFMDFTTDGFCNCKVSVHNFFSEATDIAGECFAPPFFHQAKNPSKNEKHAHLPASLGLLT